MNLFKKTQKVDFKPPEIAFCFRTKGTNMDYESYNFERWRPRWSQKEVPKVEPEMIIFRNS